MLTTRGWVPINEVTIDDHVATLQPDDDGDKLVYAPPIDVLHFPDYKGKMYHVMNKAIDMNVTMNHRMWISKKQGSSNEWKPYELVNADQLIGKMVRYKKDAVWDQPEYQFTLPGLDDAKHNYNKIERSFDMDAWIQYFGLWMAEGWATSGNRVEICQCKPRVQRIIMDIITRLGYNYSLSENESKITIVSKQLHSYLSTLSVGAPKKRLPDWVWLMSKRQSRLLLEHMVLGDGTWRRNSISYYTSSDGLADDVMRLCLHAGWSGVKYKHINKGQTTTIRQHTFTNAHVIWRISIIQCRNQPTVNSTHGKTMESVYEYEGPVHCLQVPGEVFYVRRNGKAVWTGNSRGANGPVVLLTRQPAEGRARDGGLRLGEMELECLWAHGTQSFLKERFMECSDNYRVFVCRQCGMMAPVNPELGLFYCRACKNVTDFAEVRIPYACKLLLQEVQTMSIGTRFITQ